MMDLTADVKTLSPILKALAKIEGQFPIYNREGALTIGGMNASGTIFVECKFKDVACNPNFIGGVDLEQLNAAIKGARGNVTISVTTANSIVRCGSRTVTLPSLDCNDRYKPHAPSIPTTVSFSVEEDAIVSIIETMSSLRGKQDDGACEFDMSASGLTLRWIGETGKRAEEIIGIEGLSARGACKSSYDITQLLEAFGFGMDCKLAFGEKLPLVISYECDIAQISVIVAVRLLRDFSD